MVNFPQKLEISEVVAEILMDATDWHRLYPYPWMIFKISQEFWVRQIRLAKVIISDPENDCFVNPSISIL